MGAYHCPNSRPSGEMRVSLPRCGRAGRFSLRKRMKNEEGFLTWFETTCGGWRGPYETQGKPFEAQGYQRVCWIAAAVEKCGKVKTRFLENHMGCGTPQGSLFHPPTAVEKRGKVKTPTYETDTWGSRPSPIASDGSFSPRDSAGLGRTHR